MEKPIAVVLDSTVFKQSPSLDSELFILLLKYIRLDKIRLYIPYIVEQEYLTWIEEKISMASQRVSEAIKSLDKIYPRNLIFSQNIIDFITANQLSDTKSKIIENWGNFKKETKADILIISKEHGEKVMDSYFNGNSPFRSVKYREDIPDAFIYEAIMDLQSKENIIIFISQDKRFSETLEKDHIKTYYNLSELFNDINIKIDNKYFETNEELSRAIKILKYFKNEFENKLDKETSFFESVENIENTIFDNIYGNIDTFYSLLKNIIYDYNDLAILDKGLFSLPFSGKIITSVNYIISKDEVLLYPKNRIDSLKEMIEKDINSYEIDENFENPIVGKCIIKIDDSDPLKWGKNLNELKVEIENIAKSTT